MRDGTLKHINPFTKTEVWTVPGRGNKPISNRQTSKAHPVTEKPLTEEDFCNFCHKKMPFTPPEKERIILRDKEYQTIKISLFEDLYQTVPLFRRVPNLFEIVTYNYWKENYNYKIPQTLLEGKQRYLSTEPGKNHVLDVMNTKLSAANIDPNGISDDEKLNDLSNPFFAGCHELIIGGKHHSEGAKSSLDMCSSGELSIEEHFHYINFTIRSMEDIFQNNRFVRYVSIFQNWLAAAGASFDHLHKQLVGLDEWGGSIGQKIRLVRDNRNVFNELGANFAAYNDLIFAENDYALAYVDIGHRFPTLAIYSKCQEPYPSKQTEAEIRGMSEILHACHKAMGHELSCNEEWYYTPYDTIYVIPWHILLKWRTNIVAGFEGGTGIYINPVSPVQTRDLMVPRLFELRERGLISPNIRIAEESRITKNPLLYFRSGY